FAGDDGRQRRVGRSIFVVGDEKQSIFSFQGAAPERLAQEASHYQLVAAAAQRPFERVPLEKSWRSTREVLAYVDAVFAAPELGRALRPRTVAEEAEAIRHLARRDDGPGTIDLWPLEREAKEDPRGAWDEPLDAG